jgi:hypothetical protein
MSQPNKPFSYAEWQRNQVSLEAQGRFGPVNEPVVVTDGSVYPALPEGNPFAADIVPTEQPLGYSVEALPAVGEPHEVAASIEALGSASAAPTPSVPKPPMGAVARGDGPVHFPPGPSPLVQPTTVVIGEEHRRA